MQRTTYDSGSKHLARQSLSLLQNFSVVIFCQLHLLNFKKYIMFPTDEFSFNLKSGVRCLFPVAVVETKQVKQTS